MALEGSLQEIKTRLLVSNLKKQAVTAAKFRGSVSVVGTATPVIPITPPLQIIPEGVGAFQFSGQTNPLGFPGQLQFPSQLPGQFPFNPQLIPTLGALGCDQITNKALRDACKLGLSLLPGGQTPSEAIVETGTKTTAETTRTTTGTGVVVQGSFGLPAALPIGETRTVRSCGPRMVLGIDNLCYPKAVLPPRSKFRKWRRAPKPPITRRDVVAIRRASAAKDRVAELAKDVGLSVSRTKRRAKPSKADVHHAK